LPEERGTPERPPALRPWIWTSIVLCLSGIGVSGYLSAKRLMGGSLACSRWAQCDTVNNSPYAKIHGVPVAFIGLVAYFVLLAVCLAALQNDGRAQRNLLWLGFLFSLGGVAFSAYLTYLEVYVIKAICVWCVASAITITLLAVVGAISLSRAARGGPAPR
jgi:uncharacterized membrane protein